MRHGEAEHNVAAARDGDSAYLETRYRDAPLTAKGREQILESARELQKIYPKIDLILSSPLTRTIQTARCVKEVLPCPPKIIILEALTECQGGGHICNLRQPMPLLQSLNPDTDCSMISPYTGFYNDDYRLKRPRENTTSMLWRAHSFLSTIQMRLQKWLPPTKQPCTILVVSHHDTLDAWLGKSLKNGEYIIVKDLKDIKTPNAAYTWR